MSFVPFCHIAPTMTSLSLPLIISIEVLTQDPLRWLFHPGTGIFPHQRSNVKGETHLFYVPIGHHTIAFAWYCLDTEASTLKHLSCWYHFICIDTLPLFYVFSNVSSGSWYYSRRQDHTDHISGGIYFSDTIHKPAQNLPLWFTFGDVVL